MVTISASHYQGRFSYFASAIKKADFPSPSEGWSVRPTIRSDCHFSHSLTHLAALPHLDGLVDAAADGEGRDAVEVDGGGEVVVRVKSLLTPPAKTSY